MSIHRNNNKKYTHKDITQYIQMYTQRNLIKDIWSLTETAFKFFKTVEKFVFITKDDGCF